MSLSSNRLEVAGWRVCGEPWPVRRLRCRAPWPLGAFATLHSELNELFWSVPQIGMLTGGRGGPIIVSSEHSKWRIVLLQPSLFNNART